MTLSYPSHTPSTRFPTGTVLALPAAFRFKDYHPYLSQYFSSCGSHYPETPGTLGLCVSMTKPATYTIDTLPCCVALWSTHVSYKTWWRWMDSNHRAFYRTDLQSAAFSHSATSPKWYTIAESNRS